MPRKHAGQFNVYKRKQPAETNGDAPTTPSADPPSAKRPVLGKKFQSQEAKTSFADLGGCESQQREALTHAVYLKKPKIASDLGVAPTNGLLLHGPPGTGKTSFAKAVAGELNIPLFFVCATELVAGISGESERKIRELFAEAAANAPSVLLLDDIDGIASKRENAQREMERRIVAQLIASMDEIENQQVLTIGTTSRLEVLDASIRRSGRFDQEIAFGMPDERSRLKILEVVTRGMKIGADVSLPQLARLTPGYVGSDLRTLVRTVSMCALKRLLVDKIFSSTSSGITHQAYTNRKEREVEEICTELKNLQTWIHSNEVMEEEMLANFYVSFEDFLKALQIVLPSAKREGFATVPDVKWSDVGALKEIRNELKWSILYPIQEPERFHAFGMEPRAQGILLCGPPGCGKTLLAKAVANETGMNFISVKGPELLSMYVGESERSVRTVFQRARDSSPCVIFFDEIDALCPKRSNSEATGSSRLVNQLLTEMDGMEKRKEVFLIGATNRPDMVDPAVLRPGRFDKVLFVDFPNSEDRVDILRKATKNGECPKLSPSIDLNIIGNSAHLQYFTGADIVALVHEAGVIALKQKVENLDDTFDSLTMQHFELAMERVTPSVGEQDRIRYENLRRKYSKTSG